MQAIYKIFKILKFETKHGLRRMCFYFLVFFKNKRQYFREIQRLLIFIHNTSQDSYATVQIKGWLSGITMNFATPHMHLSLSLG